MQTSFEEYQQHLQSIYQTIHTQYLENLAPFVHNSSHYLPFQYTLSTIVHITHAQYNDLFLTTEDGYVAVPVSNHAWLYLRPKISSINSKTSPMEMDTMRRLQTANSQQMKRSKLESEEKQAKVLYQCMGRIDSSEDQIKYQIILLREKQQKTKVVTPYFGIIMKDHSAEMESQHNQFFVPAQAESSPETEFIFVSYHGLVYLAGFKVENHQIMFDSTFKNVLDSQFYQAEGVLNLGSENIGKEGLKYIASNHSANLVSLNLWWNMLNQEGAQILAQGYYPKLKFLDLRKNFIGDTGLMHFDVNEKYDLKQLLTRCFPNTQRIFLTDNNLSSAKHINRLIFPSLRELQLQNNHITLNNPTDIQIPALQTLRILSLRNNRISGQGLSSLWLDGLEELHLSSNEIITCQPLASAYLPKLAVLNLDKNKISSVKWLKKCIFVNGDSKGLITLDISGNEVREISSLSYINWWRLRQLRINSNKKSSIIKQYDQVSGLHDLCKLEMRKSDIIRKIQINVKSSGLNSKKKMEFIGRKLQSVIIV